MCIFCRSLAVEFIFELFLEILFEIPTSKKLPMAVRIAGGIVTDNCHCAFCYVFRRNHICQSFCWTVSYCIFDLFDCDDYIFDQKEIQKQIVFMYNEGIIKYLACIFHARYSRITVFLMRYAAAVLCVIYTPRSSAFGMYFLTVWRNSLSSSVL